MPNTTKSHYTQLAENYDLIWSEYPWSEYVPWMNKEIATRLQLSPGEHAADIGAGTGTFITDLMQCVSPETPLLCVDPSSEMMARLPDDPRIRKIRARTEDLIDGSLSLPYERLDVILMKETIHHARDLHEAFRFLSGMLTPGGRILIVTLPRRLDYPLFSDAHTRYSSRQPEPADMAASMAAAGLEVALSYDQFPVSCSREHYLHRMEERFLSVLSTFSEQEFRSGMEELTRAHPEETFVFVERRAFILGHAKS